MSTRWQRRLFVRELADALLQERWDAGAFAERTAAELGVWTPSVNRLAFAAAASARPVTGAPGDDHGRREALVAAIDRFLSDHPRAVQDLLHPPLPPSPPSTRPALSHGWPIAPLATTAELAAALELSDGQLAWLADPRGLERTVAAERLRNYRYRWSPRRGGLERLIESPKARLKEIQRWLLREILDAIPPHPAAHGFVPGRSVHTHAALHAGAEIVIRLDLRDFFASVSAGRVHGLLVTVGYPAPVARVLTGLATNRTPVAVLAAMAPVSRPGLVTARYALERHLAGPHLPQGAPTSPALANLAAFGLDRRLTGLAARFGMTYSRYADDLTFSGPGPGRRGRAALSERIAAIVREEGFTVNLDKTMVRGRAQRQLVTGLVVNDRPRTPRDEYDRLRAQLHRLAHAGPVAEVDADGAAVRAQLRGRVAWVAATAPERGRKLARMLDAISWVAPGGRGGPGPPGGPGD